MFADRLREAREKAGFSQSGFARHIGMTRDLYNKYEIGRSNPNYENLQKIAESLGVTTDYLLGIEKPATHDDEQPVDVQIEDYVKRFMNLSPENKALALHYLGLLENRDTDKKP